VIPRPVGTRTSAWNGLAPQLATIADIAHALPDEET